MNYLSRNKIYEKVESYKNAKDKCLEDLKRSSTDNRSM